MYIVIETFDPYFPFIVVNEIDGSTLVFDNKEDAQIEAEKCQKGIVVLI
jgi:hypothetical protein